MNQNNQLKFEFTPEFQADLIKYTLTGKGGYKLLDLLQSDYFSYDEDAIVFEAIQTFHKENVRLPSQTLLLEKLRGMFSSNDYRGSFSLDDQEAIRNTVKGYYVGYVKDGDIIYDKAVKFAKYVGVTHVIEDLDPTDVNNYEVFLGAMQQAMAIGRDNQKELGSFLIKDLEQRQLARRERETVIPTPFRQLNKLTNAGGYARGSIAVILDRPKKFKTGAMINLAKGYLKMKKRVFIADLENGEDEYMTRVEQSVSGRSKNNIVSGKEDTRVKKILRKYRRLGAELVVQRFPAHRTTTLDIQAAFNKVKAELGIDFQILIVDYAALMGTTTGKKDDTERISDVYLDLANLAKDEDLEHIWTANHIKREAIKRESTRYRGEDIAKAMDIVRHVQAIYGLNRTPEEEEAGIMRMEIVEQRDGKPTGRALFHVDLENQDMKELTKKEQDDYYEEYGTPLDRAESGGEDGVVTQGGKRINTDL